MKSQLIGKDLDAGEDWRQKEKGAVEDEMVRYHHQLNGHKFEQTLKDSEREGSLACCGPWVTKSWTKLGFPSGSDNKAPTCNAGDPGSIPGLGRSPREGNGNPLQYSCLEKSMDRGARWATVHGVAKSWIQLKQHSTHTC